MAFAGHEPVVARRRLKTELRQARKLADRTQREVAQAMEWSTAKLIRIESGEVKISRNDLKALLEFYGITDAERVAELQEIARAVRDQESWSDFRDLLHPSARRYLGFEAAAAVIRSYQPIVVPGQLQIEEYFRSLVRDLELAPQEPRETIDRRWDTRLRRQRMHERDAPPRMHFVIDEAAVRRPVGGRGTMRWQLLALQDYTRQSHVTIQILPFAAGAHPGLNNRFVHLEFDNVTDDDIVFLEEPDLVLLEDPEETAPYLERFFRLSEIALPPEDTIAFLDRVLADMEREAGGAGPG